MTVLEFVKDNQDIIILAWLVGGMIFFAVRRKLSRQLHPPIDMSKVTFVENYASGYSPSALIFGRFGVSKNSLFVAVSTDAVLIEPVKWFKWFLPVGLCDLEHYIQKNEIEYAGISNDIWCNSVQVQFTSRAGEKKLVVLRLEKPEEFLASLRG